MIKSVVVQLLLLAPSFFVTTSRAQDSTTTTTTTTTTTQTTSPSATTFPHSLPDDAVAPLREACNALLGEAVKKPYGWAWEQSPSADPVVRRSPPVDMQRLASPAAGLALLWAGNELNDDSFRDAARQAARGVAASFSANGAVLRRPTFGQNAGGHDDRAYVPPRDSTIAGLALLLAELDASSDPNDPTTPQLRASAIRATTWLLHQQAHNGAWPVGFPPHAGDHDAVKIVRLDNPNFRDATIALFLAGDMLHLQIATDAAKRSIDFLTHTRLSDPIRSANLWATAYTIDGDVVNEDLTFPGGADSLASRYAIETLLVGSCFDQNEATDVSIERAAKALAENRRGPDMKDPGTWDRYPEPGQVHGPATRPIKPGIPTQPAIALPVEPADFGIAQLLVVTTHWKQTERSLWIESLSNDPTRPTLRGRLLADCTGILDGPFTEQAASIGDDSSVAEHSSLKHRILAAAKWLLFHPAEVDAR